MINPSDPEATYRTKAKVAHRGYVANIEETVGKNGSVVTDYEYEPNIYSDTQILKDRLEELPEQEEPILLVTDGGYFSDKNVETAAEKNIQLVTTGLTGLNAEDILRYFVYNEEQTKVEQCPAGHKPRSSYAIGTEKIRSGFERTQCETCPYREQRRPKIRKRVVQVTIYRKSILRAMLH